MRIGIDARMFGPEQGGLGRYVQQLIFHLEQIKTSDEFVIFLRSANWGAYEPSKPNFTKLLADIPWYGFAEQTKLPKIIESAKVDLMHFPHWNVPLFYNKPFVVTIHDLLLLHHPRADASTHGKLIYSMKQLGFKAVLRHACKASKHILTVSQFSKDDLVQTLKIAPQKISVHYPAPLPAGVNESFKDFSITKPYALYVGVAYPHKNLDALLKAWTKFCQDDHDQHQLVLAGKKNFFYDRLIKRFSDLFSSKKVIFTDFVTDEELNYLYHHATAFVFPSLYEGFGMPPLEAMTWKIPVAAAKASCLPEVLGDSAFYFDPLNIDSIKNAFTPVFTDQSSRAELIKKGEITAQKYRWDNLAKSTWEVYKNNV